MRPRDEWPPALRHLHLTPILHASVAALLVCLGPDARAQPADAAPPASPLVVFAPAHAARAGASALSAEQAATLETIRSDPAASGIRIGRSVPAALTAALDTRALSIVLPPTPGASSAPGGSDPGASAHAADPLIAFTGVDVAHHDEDLVSLHARDDTTDSEVALVVQGLDVLGSIRRGDEVWKVHPLGGGRTALYRYDTSQLRRHPPNWGERMRRQRPAPETPPRGDPTTRGAAADTGDVIDLLVAYTPAARAAAGNIDAFIRFAIDNTHRIYGNSRIGVRLRLVHKHQVNYAQHSDMGVDLDRLTAVDDGYMDEVHGLRDRYGADLVALIIGRQTDSACGIAWAPDFGRYPEADWSARGFSVTAHNCETADSHTFAHELGHNQGADHDPDNSTACGDATRPCSNPRFPAPPTFPYRYGRCNVAQGWHTTMSYRSNTRGDCRREIEYFSSPVLRYRGTPTGDAARRDNRRVLTETARRVANYRQSKNPPTASGPHTLPLVTAASNPGQEGFVRIINHSRRAGTVRIHAVDDTGRRFGPVSLSLGAMAAVQFNSRDLERGNTAKGLSAGVGDGSGNWRLELASELEIEPLAYIRSPDGFLTSMHELAAETETGTHRYHVPFFNPASNVTKVSLLRLINPGDVPAQIEITGVDDAGEPAPLGSVRLRLNAGAARRLSAAQLEGGDPDLTGRLGDGTGKWRLLVSAERPLQVMSLLRLATGHLTNLSRGRAGVSVATPPPPATGPDLVVGSPSVSESSPDAGQAFTLSARVRNQGETRSAATTLRYYRSPDATITTGDTPTGTDAVGALAAAAASNESIRLTAPSSAGTYYYGACVERVSGESDTTNNCSSAVRVTVAAPPPVNYWGAIASGWRGQYCADGYAWGGAVNRRDRDSAIHAAEILCRTVGGNNCSWDVVFQRCGALAYGESSSRCGLYGGSGATRSAAEWEALSECRDDNYTCRIAEDHVFGSGKASYCNGAYAGTTPHPEAGFGRGTGDVPPGTSHPEPRPRPDRSRRSGDGG